MSSFYTNVVRQGKHIYLRGYENGKRVKRVIPFRPYLFIPTKKETQFRSVYGLPVDKIYFDDPWEARKFQQKYEDIDGFEIFGFDKFEYCFIHDNYLGTIEYDMNLVNVIGIDLECDTTDSYPKVEEGDKTITAITVRRKNKRVAFGYKDFDPPEGTHYVKCKDEFTLLRNFLTLWNTDEWSPDIVTSWNGDFFDIPYLVNRIRRVLGEEYTKMLSPWGILKEKMIMVRGREMQTYIPAGFGMLDYQQLYKKFTQNQQSSYSLNNICHVELGLKKTDYSEYKDLDDLYERNHQLFMEYNIRDVDLIFLLEEKLRFIELAAAIAYDAKVNFNDVFTSVLLWDVIIYNYLMDQNIVVPQYKRAEERPFEGGYVKEPQVGLHEWVVSFDLASLYPSIIQQYNISPETFVKKIDMNVERCLAGQALISEYSVAANGCLYRKDKKGFLPALMESQFQQREEYKKKLKEARKAKDENLITKYDRAQMAKKIEMNSLYGSLSNAGFRFFDVNHAEAITNSGQLSTKYIERELNVLLNKFVETTGVDFVLASDTDSAFLNLGPLVNKFCKNNTRDQIIDFLAKLSIDTIEPYIDKKYDILAKQQNAMKNVMKMNREIIADKAIWIAKKRYMANVWDKGGDRFTKPELKLTGIETVRSSTPEICRKALEEAIFMILNKDERELQNYIAEFKEQFFKAPFDEVAFPRGANNLEKYADPATIYKIRTPIHVKGALIYNKMLEDRGINKAEPIWSGDKIKFTYLKMPNPTHDTVISSPGYLPFEDLNDYIDYATQFEKSFLEPLNNILSTIKWTSSEEESLEGLF